MCGRRCSEGSPQGTLPVDCLPLPMDCCLPTGLGLLIPGSVIAEVPESLVGSQPVQDTVRTITDKGRVLVQSL